MDEQNSIKEILSLDQGDFSEKKYFNSQYFMFKLGSNSFYFFDSAKFTIGFNKSTQAKPKLDYISNVSLKKQAGDNILRINYSSLSYLSYDLLLHSQENSNSQQFFLRLKQKQPYLADIGFQIEERNRDWVR